jgi:hypothetical protein
MNIRIKNLGWLFGAALLVVGVGALEDWYGWFNYGADGVAYLDLAQAVAHGDWRLATSPYWSVGYPAILASARWMFPPGPLGEWTSVHVVNLVCYLATYLSFLAFLSTGACYAAWSNGRAEMVSEKRFVLVIGTGLFLLIIIENMGVSRVSPDLLVSGTFFLACAMALRFFLRPTAMTAIGLGLLLAFGYLLKAVFLAFSAMILALLLLHLFLRRPADRGLAMAKLGWVLPAFAFLALPCIIATSAALGRFTLGETGSLNYAWTVNHLPHGTMWQGGPGNLGQPLHPPKMLWRNPPVFAFGEPFHVTYPPIFNQFYWYDGYHRFFNLGNQLHALKANAVDVLKSFVPGPHLIPKGIAELAALLFWLAFLPGRRREWCRRFLTLWPVYLPALAGLVLYMFVVIEPRYLIGFLLILATMPFLALYVPTELPPRKLTYLIIALVALAVVVIPAARKPELFRRIWTLESYTSDPQWKIGFYLVQAGLHPGDKVASVNIGHGAFCTWAHVSGVRVVAQIGNNTFDPLNQDADFQLFADHPDIQQTVFNLFKQAGAVMVIVPDVKYPLQGPGWGQVPGTEAWVHRLD